MVNLCRHLLWLKLHRICENAIITYAVSQIASDSGPDLCRYQLTSGHNQRSDPESLSVWGCLTRLLLQCLFVYYMVTRKY